MEIIYIDLHFLINLLTDYLLCLATARFCGLSLKRLRYFLAAVPGAIYSVAVLLPALSQLKSPLFILLTAVLMGIIAFGSEARPLRCTLAFLGVSAAFGGGVWALSMAAGGSLRLDIKTLIFSFALCYGVLSLFFRSGATLPEKPRAKVELTFLGRQTEFFVLLDSGNSLADPISGSPVMPLCPAALRSVFAENAALLELSAVELMETAEAVPALKGRFRLVAYSALGGGGLMAAFRPDSLVIDGRERSDVLAAISPQARGEGFLGIF